MSIICLNLHHSTNNFKVVGREGENAVECSRNFQIEISEGVDYNANSFGIREIIVFQALKSNRRYKHG